MFVLYIIQVEGKYKIGIHTGDKAKLTNRYITSLPQMLILEFYVFDDQKLVRCIENEIKELYINNRVKNSNNNLSEWFVLSDIELNNIKNIIETNNPINNLFDQYVMTNIEIKKMVDSLEIKRPNYQRPVDETRISIIQDYIAKNNKSRSFILPPIILNEIKGSYHIIDGQHRLLSITTIEEKINVSVIVYKGLTYSEEFEMFKSLNKAVPCLDIYLSEGSIMEIQNELRTSLKTMFTVRCSPSKGCRIPNFYLDNFLNNIFGKSNEQESIFDRVYMDGKIVDTKTLLAEILKINTIVGNKLQSPGGYNYYRTVCPPSGRKHTPEKFQEMLKNEKQCYIGFVDSFRFSLAINNTESISH